MSTIVPELREEGDAYTAAKLNAPVSGLTDGFNALASDDLKTEGFGVEAVHPVVIETVISSPVRTLEFGDFTTTFSTTSTSWTKVQFTTPAADASIEATGSGFAVGATSADYVGCVQVGVSYEVYMSGGFGYVSIGVEDSISSPTVNSITESQFPVDATSASLYRYGSLEFIIQEADFTASSLLEKIWFMVKSDNVADTITVDNVHMWAIPLHSEG